MPNLILQKCYIIFLIYFKISTNSKNYERYLEKVLIFLLILQLLEVVLLKKVFLKKNKMEMEMNYLSSIIIGLFILTSCTSELHYIQVFKTEFTGGKKDNNYIIFENNEIEFKYNVLSNKGNLSIIIFNKSNNDIILDLDQSFFIYNLEVKDYYYYQSIENKLNSSSSNSFIQFNNNVGLREYTVENTLSSSLNTYSKQYLTIPSNSYRTLQKFQLIESYFNHCDISKFPKISKFETVTFNEKNTPLKFSNIITYKFKNNIQTVRHNFYVNEITNYVKDDLKIEINKSECGKNLKNPIEVLNLFDPSSFYYEYGRYYK